MSLPILNARGDSPDDLLRLFHRTELHWARQVAQDEVSLDVGVALTNPQLLHVHDANSMRDAFIPDGMSARDVAGIVDEHFRAAGTRCAKWLINPSAPPQRTRPLEEHLLASGHRRELYDLMRLTGRPAAAAAAAAGAIAGAGGLRIIPARASFRHARQIAEEIGSRWPAPGIADALMLHLEDPHTDALLALKDGEVAALVTVLAVGEMGTIEGLDVSARFRRQGIGRTMMSRALEICARSLFKHVFLTVAPDNGPAQALYRACGFERIGEFSLYRLIEG